MNFIELVRIGKDAVTGTTQAGKQVCNFSAAFDSGWGENKQTIWLDCSAWGDRYTKLSEYIVKGSQIVVAGDIGQREHNGKTYLTLDVKDIKLCDKRADRAQVEPKPEGRPPVGRHTEAQNAGRKEAAQFVEDFDDDIPF